MEELTRRQLTTEEQMTGISTALGEIRRLVEGAAISSAEAAPASVPFTAEPPTRGPALELSAHIPLQCLPDVATNPFPAPLELEGPELFDPPTSQFPRMAARDQHEARVLHSALHAFFRIVQELREVPAAIHAQPADAVYIVQSIVGQMDRAAGLLATRLAALNYAAEHGMAEAAAVYASIARPASASVSPQFAAAEAHFQQLRQQERFKAAAKTGQRGAYGDFAPSRGRGGRGGGSTGGGGSGRGRGNSGSNAGGGTPPHGGGRGNPSTA